MIAAVFYGCFGLWFLCRFLQSMFNEWISITTTLILFLCTNLYYYIIDASGMSHVYSFFLCSLLLWSSKKYFTEKTIFLMVLISAVISLAVLIRPTNLLFASIFFAFDFGNSDSISNRFSFFFKTLWNASYKITKLQTITNVWYHQTESASPLTYHFANMPLKRTELTCKAISALTLILLFKTFFVNTQPKSFKINYLHRVENASP